MKTKMMMKAYAMSMCMASMVFTALPSGCFTASAAYENTHINTGNQREDIVAVAETQIGYHEGANNETKYNHWFGAISNYPANGYGYPWCHAFVSWCANQAGIPRDIVPYTANCPDGKEFFVNDDVALWEVSAAHGGSYVPQRGDIIYFGSSPDHVGIVYECNGSTVYTIEGNSSDQVIKHSYNLNDSYVLAYGVPDYNGGSTPPPPLTNDDPYAPYPRPSGDVSIGMKGDSVRWVQYTLSQWLGYDIGSSGIDGDFGDATETAVANYQNSKDLTPDGIVGEQTRAAIIADIDWIIVHKDTEKPVISDIQVYNIDATGYSISCTVTDNVGVAKVQFPTWTDNNGQDDLIWHDASANGNSYSYRISISDHNNEYGRYITHIYAWDAAGNGASAGGADFELKIGSKMDKGAGQTVPDGDYYIFSKLKENYYLDIDGADVPAESKTNVHMWTSSSSKLPECDTWTVKYAGNGFYTISQKGTEICLDLYGANIVRGANVCAHKANGSDAQLWSISSTDTGYKIQAKCSGYCLDIESAKKDDGTNVQVWESNNAESQRWDFIPL
ncbi:MAG: RICIN domain-containing protein, partial [Oscillospiraceae bacterium]|nr:RICIN domain-containing protein [Oscillospiraceae bacterium]